MLSSQIVLFTQPPSGLASFSQMALLKECLVAYTHKIRRIWKDGRRRLRLEMSSLRPENDFFFGRGQYRDAS